MFGLRACLWKAFRMQEGAIVLGSYSFRESREKSQEKSGSAVRPARESWKPAAVGEFVSLSSARES